MGTIKAPCIMPKMHIIGAFTVFKVNERETIYDESGGELCV